MPIARSVPSTVIPRTPSKSVRRARRDAEQSAPQKPASGTVQRIVLKIPSAKPLSKKKSLLGVLFGLKPKSKDLDRGQSPLGLSIDRSRRIFIEAEAYGMTARPSPTFGRESGEYMGSALVGTANAAGMAHFSLAMDVLDTLNDVFLAVGQLRKPKLTPGQSGVLQRLSEANPTPAGLKPGVWLTVGQAMDMDLPPAWYEDPDDPTTGRWITPVDNGKRRLAALNEQRYAQSKTLATNAPRPV